MISKSIIFSKNRVILDKFHKFILFWLMKRKKNCYGNQITIGISANRNKCKSKWKKKKLFGNFVKHAIKRSLASMNKGVGLDFIKHHSLLKHTWKHLHSSIKVNHEKSHNTNFLVKEILSSFVKLQSFNNLR